MIQLLNPLLLGGAVAVAAPVIIHLLHRRKAKRVDWGAMRFLLELLARSRRRLWLHELLLLVVRTAVIACIALAMVRPAFERSSAKANGNGMMRQGRTASVLMIDDSVSSAVGRAQPAIASMKKLALGYVDSLAAGDEVSVLLMSQLGSAASDPVFDLQALKSQLAAMGSSTVATDVPRLVDAALAQLKRHINPGAELVLVTDGRREGWRQEETALWEDLRQRLRGPGKASFGTRGRPTVLVLAPPASAVEDNLAITSLRADRTLVTAGSPTGLRVRVANFGKGVCEPTVQLAINGRVLGSKSASIPPGDAREVVFNHTFDVPGSYSLESMLVNHRDVLAGDDRRALALQVESSLPVLLVENGPHEGLKSDLGFLALALSPETSGRGPFELTRVTLAQLTPAMLQNCRVVVLGDLPLLEPSMLDALERFVVSGGGVLVGLGPHTDLQAVNRFWARGGEGFLPCPLERAVKPERPSLPVQSAAGHPVFSAFPEASDQAWKAARVKSWFKLDLKQNKGTAVEVLLKLDTNDPLVVECRRGLGLVSLMTTTLGADWTDLPLQAAYVPLMRGLVGHLGSFVIPPRNLAPGERIIYPPRGNSAQQVRGIDPNGKPLNLTSGAWEGREAVLSKPLLEPGTYSLQDPVQTTPVRFAVALNPAESALMPITDREISQVFDGQVQIFHSAEQIVQNLDPARRQSVELWKWLLLGAVGLMFVEGWLSRSS